MKKSILIVLILALIIIGAIFFYPKDCGGSGGLIGSFSETNCDCLGFKGIAWFNKGMLDYQIMSCYGICLKDTCETSTDLVGGCGGVYYPYWQECCDNWALENDIVHIQCTGNWTVENNQCVWNCS